MIINRTKTNPYKCEQVRIMPGMNQITSKDWDKIKNNPSVKSQLKSGVLKVMGQEDSKSKPKEFHELPADECIELLKDCLDKPTLLEFQEQESSKRKRATVLAAIDVQLNLLANPPITGDDS